MKHTLLTLAAILTASLTQAASLSWAISNIKTSDGKGNSGENYTAMLFLTAKTGSFDGDLTTLAAVTDLADQGKYDDIAELAVATGKGNTNGGVTGATGFNGNNFGSGDSLTGFAIIIDQDQKNYFTTGYASASWTSTAGMKMLNFGSQANATYKSFGTSQPDIPEPATGALALAGVALLFRRRR